MLQDLASKLHQSNGMQNKTLRGPEGFIQPLLRSQSFASALDTRRARPRRALLLYQSDCQTTKMSVERQIFLTHADHCFRLRESCVATLRTDRHQIGLSDRHHRNTHHLINWELQPQRRTRPWEDTISNSRREIDFLADRTPSLKRHLLESFDNAYTRACRYALRETRLPPQLPSACGPPSRFSTQAFCQSSIIVRRGVFRPV